MKNDNVIDIAPLGGGNNITKLVTIKSLDGMEIKGVFKPYEPFNLSANIHSDVAAYLFDRLLRINLVPMTIIRTIDLDGKKVQGSLMFFVDNTKTANKLAKEDQIIPAKMKLFDYLIRNWDRRDNPGNYLFEKDKDGNAEPKKSRAIAIDNSWAFRINDWWHDIEPAGKDAKGKYHGARRAHVPLSKGGVLKLIPDKTTYERLKKLTNSEIRNALKSELNFLQINQLIERKNRYIYKV
ncbi:MAG: hypothetical protein HQK49_15460 [Oligoflexia bacterium]|nr:hypothetical protein [Oligoflexia bacterium]